MLAPVSPGRAATPSTRPDTLRQPKLAHDDDDHHHQHGRQLLPHQAALTSPAGLQLLLEPHATVGTRHPRHDLIATVPVFSVLSHVWRAPRRCWMYESKVIAHRSGPNPPT
jgi:hypothetical protein